MNVGGFVFLWDTSLPAHLFYTCVSLHPFLQCEETLGGNTRITLWCYAGKLEELVTLYFRPKYLLCRMRISFLSFFFFLFLLEYSCFTVLLVWMRISYALSACPPTLTGCLVVLSLGVVIDKGRRAKAKLRSIWSHWAYILRQICM